MRRVDLLFNRSGLARSSAPSSHPGSAIARGWDLLGASDILCATAHEPMLQPGVIVAVVAPVEPEMVRRTSKVGTGVVVSEPPASRALLSASGIWTATPAVVSLISCSGSSPPRSRGLVSHAGLRARRSGQSHTSESRETCHPCISRALPSSPTSFLGWLLSGRLILSCQAIHSCMSALCLSTLLHAATRSILHAR